MEINGLDSEKLFLTYVLTFVECFKGSYHSSPCNLSKESQRSEILRMLHDSPQLDNYSVFIQILYQVQLLVRISET